MEPSVPSQDLSACPEELSELKLLSPWIPPPCPLPWTLEHGVLMFLGALCPPEHGHSSLRPCPAFLTSARPQPQPWLRLPRIPLVIRNGNSRLGTFNNGAQRNACKAKLLHLHCLGIFLHIIKIRIFCFALFPLAPLPAVHWERGVQSPGVGSGAFPDPMPGFWRGGGPQNLPAQLLGASAAPLPPHPTESVSRWFGTAGTRSCFEEWGVLCS